jgi:predicted transcriptional regulator
MNERQTVEAAKERMTVKEIAEQLGCAPETVKKHIREVFPSLMETGKKTYLNEAQVTVILEHIKKPVSSGALSNLQFETDRLETSKSKEFRLAMLYKESARLEHELRVEAEEKLSETRRDLAAERSKTAEITQENTDLHEWLRIRNEELINAGLALSDREDRAALYRRWK